MRHTGLLTALIINLLHTSSALGDIDTDLMISAERTHQSFEDGSTDIDSVSLSPTLNVGYWSLSALLEWQKIKGVYFVNQRFPNLPSLCQRVSSLAPASQDFLVRRDRLTQEQIDNCNLLTLNPDMAIEDSSEGMTDAELFANYYLPPLTDNVGGSLGVGYKHDNGDSGKRLGTGTREAFVETSWLFTSGRVSLLSTLGYQTVLKDSTAYDLSDYGYGSLDLNLEVMEAFAVGVTYSYIEANTEVLGDLDYLDWYMELGAWHGFSARLSFRDYRNEPDYPDEDISASINYRF